LRQTVRLIGLELATEPDTASHSDSNGVSVSGLSADQQVTRADCSPGNELARSRNPNLTLPTDTIVNDAPKTGIGPINIITRSRAGRASRVPDTSPTNIANDDSDRCTSAAKELGHIDVTDINKAEQYDKTKFAQQQHTDAGLQHFWRMASNNESTFVVHSGLPYKRIPAHISSMHEFALVLPACREKEVIQLAHDHCLSGHLGVRKTEKRINSLFYFPKMRQKVRWHINTCNSCQMTKPVKRNERVPLQTMDVLAKHAFDDLSLDIIGGELPRTRSGNRYILLLSFAMSANGQRSFL